MKLNPANCAVTEELPSILWNPKIHYHVHKSHPVALFLNQINLIHIILSYHSNIHLTLFTYLRLGLPSGIFPSGFPTNILYAFLF
jgi:hypothetical protein